MQNLFALKIDTLILNIIAKTYVTISDQDGHATSGDVINSGSEPLNSKTVFLFCEEKRTSIINDHNC